MNPLYEELPDTVTVEGEAYRIITDFREWIRFIDLVKNKEISQADKVVLYQQWYLDKVPARLDQAIDALVEFLAMEVIPKCGNGVSGRGVGKPVFSYAHDAPYIIAGFKECYGIDLLSVPYMHWWHFRMLFQGLNEETEIMRRIAYRSVNPNDIKDKEEHKRIRRIQREIALPGREMSDYDIGNAFA